jgi:hypothetical protein
VRQRGRWLHLERRWWSSWSFLWWSFSFFLFSLPKSCLRLTKVWFAGLRGAIAFALSTQFQGPHRQCAMAMATWVVPSVANESRCAHNF